MTWGTASARARGLATHLLDRATLLAAAAAGSWAAAVHALVRHGYPVGAPAQLTPQDFDRAIGRLTAARLALLARWLGARRRLLAVVYEDEERRTLRVLLRGTVQGASSEARLRGVIPTPGLSERALEQLARAGSPRQLVDLLIRLGHPAGRALAAEGVLDDAARRERAADAPNESPPAGPLLWRLELALSRLFARRAERAARRAGRDVRQFVSLLVDLENAWTLLALGDVGPVPPLDDLFLTGGRILSRAELRRIAALDASRRDDAVAHAFARTPLARALRPAPAAGREGRALAATLAWQRGERRRRPLGPAPVLEVIQRIRAEAHDVRLVLSAAALAMPVAAIESALATPA